MVISIRLILYGYGYLIIRGHYYLGVTLQVRIMYVGLCLMFTVLYVIQTESHKCSVFSEKPSYTGRFCVLVGRF